MSYLAWRPKLQRVSVGCGFSDDSVGKVLCAAIVESIDGGVWFNDNLHE